jgi:hypothetical protein
VAEIGVNYTPAKKVEVTEQGAAYRDNMMQQMNGDDYGDFLFKKTWYDRKRAEKNRIPK